MVMFNPCEADALERVEQTMGLEKCPDRSATIRFTRWYEFVRTTTTSSPVYHSTYLDARYTLKNNNNNNNNNNQRSNELKHSTYTNQNYGRQSKYSPAKRDTTPNRLQVGSGVNPNTPNNNNNNGAQTSRSRIRTYTSPVYENNNPPAQMMQQSSMNYNQQQGYHPQSDYRMA